jgi:hypothetical protein
MAVKLPLSKEFFLCPVNRAEAMRNSGAVVKGGLDAGRTRA